MATNHITTTTYTTHSMLSQDGAKISYLSMGSGPSVLVIPGALSVAAGYTVFASALAEHFTVHIIERRGRGLSSPRGEDYSIRKECEDVLALQHETGASFIVGHSFGGLVALEVARNNPSFAKIAVYAFIEFSLGVGPDRARNTPPWLMKLMLPLFLRPHERKLMFGLLSENLREHREVARLDSSYEYYGEIPADVLLMYGGKSQSSWVDLSMKRLAKILPRSETKEFPKLDHFGIDKKDPREVAQAVSVFFQEDAR